VRDERGRPVPAIPQPILGPATTSAIFLVVTVDDGGHDVVRQLLADLPGLCRSVSFRSARGDLSCVVGIGAHAWGRLFDGPPPARLHELPVFTGARHRSVSTPGDLLVHLRAQRMDLCFELERLIMERLRRSVTVADEVSGFRYFDARDVLGFVDGTENPTGSGADDAVHTDDRDEPDHPAGSYVIVQKYLHDLHAWDSLSTENQELIIGRRKLSDVELSDDEQPDYSHVALNTIVDEDGADREILRDNMPFGSPARDEFGTYFIGYSRDPGITETMLEHMFVGSPTGNYDRILDFSTPVTGALFYAPSADFLDDLPPAPSARPAQSSSSDAEPGSVDLSLGIGGIR
jgi:putative iron-dependent peroxidase